MARATIKLPDGTTVDIDGSAEEIAKIMHLYQPASASGSSIVNSTKISQARKPAQKKVTGRAVPRGPKGYISELAAEDFFSKKRTLPEIQKRLEEKGHIYSQMALSTPVLRLVRQRILRRLKEGGIWCYVNQ